MRTILACAAALVGLLLIVPVLLLAAPFWIVSACTRALARILEPSYLTRDQLIQFDPVFGWKPLPNLHTYHLMGDVFRISTDAHGWRGRANLAESDVVVFGDSFAAGYGVDDDHLFANLNAVPRIKPIGIGGYSMVQELLWMKELAPMLNGKLVVWFIYLGNDLYDNLSPELRGYRKPFVREIRRTGAWEIVSRHVSSEAWPIIARARAGHIHAATLAELCSDTFLGRRAYGACEFLIREGRSVCGEAGAGMVVFTVPDTNQLSEEGRLRLKSLAPPHRSFDGDLPEQRIEGICRSLGVPFVAGKSFLDLSCYKQNDCHWNERGHRRVATTLAELHASWGVQRIGPRQEPFGETVQPPELKGAASAS